MSAVKRDDNPGFVPLVALFIQLLVRATCALFTYTILALLFLGKAPISRAWNLPVHSASWPALKWVFLPLKWVAAGLFLWMLWHAYQQYASPHAGLQTGVALVLYLAIGTACALVFAVIHWLQMYAHDPVVQRSVAGQKAEAVVRKQIDQLARHYPGARALHGVLLVFHAASADEFSVEIDHLFITPAHLFVVETKYKSGTITALAEAEEWPIAVHGAPGGSMRNALRQAKNAARVVHQHVPLPCAPIPLVAIHGSDVKIVDGPGNVAAADQLAKVIAAFELEALPVLDPEAVAAQLCQHMSANPEAMQRHIARAEKARQRAELKAIVERASL